jgi:hypothetical protein
VTEYIWTGGEDVRCEIEVEAVGDRRTTKIFKATARRIQRDGLLPLAMGNGRPVEYVESSPASAIERAKLFLDRRFGFGTVVETEDATAGMRLFPLERVPDELVLASYGRYGCSICRIGEPDEEKLDDWLEHAQREHGYQVVTDRREAAPGIQDASLRFRVIRFRHLPTIEPTTVSSAEPQGDPSMNDER